MISKCFYLLLLSIVCRSVSAFPVDEYFKDSILKALKDERLVFKSDVNVHAEDIIYANVQEKYSFKSNTGELAGKEQTEKDGKNRTAKLLFIDGLEELYQIDYDDQECDRMNGTDDRIINFYLSTWVPIELEEKPKKDVVLGPSYALFLLLDEYEKDKKSVSCEEGSSVISGKINPKKCTLSLKDVRINYYFEDSKGYTMSPYKVEIYKHLNDEWRLHKELEYLKFELEYTEDSISTNLPIGFACERSFDHNYNKYPRIFQNYGNFIYMEYDVEFKFLNKNTNKPTTKKYSSTLHHIEWPDRHSVNYGISEKTGKPIKTFYKRNIGVHYRVEDGKCMRYDRKTDNQTINWYYVQDLFVNHPEFFYVEGFYYKDTWLSENNYTYLGEYMVDGEMTAVYERAFFGFNKENSPGRGNDRENVNDVYSDYIIATHYFPTHTTHWPNADQKLKVPLKIEFRLKGNDHKTDIAKLTVDINDFDEGPSKSEFDFIECVNYAPDFDNVTITFKGSADQIKLLKGKSERVHNQLLGSLYYVTPIRLGDLSAEVEGSLLTANFKLFAGTDLDHYFDVTENEAFEENLRDTITLDPNTEYDVCLKLCAETGRCRAFSHNSSSNECKMWVSYEDEREYDWSRLKTIKKNESKVGRKSLSGGTAPNKVLLGYIKESIESKDGMNIYFYDSERNVFGLKAVDIKVNN